jgi:hypothetical protein
MRICNQERCGRPLLNKNGTPNFRKHFCSIECVRMDRKEKMAQKRKYLPGKKCRLCGRKPASSTGVSQNAERGQINFSEIGHTAMQFTSKAP